MFNDNMTERADFRASEAPVGAVQAVADAGASYATRADSGPVIDAGKGTFFDEHFDIRDPEGTAFTAKILEIYDAVEPRQRKRWRTELTTRIRKLLANAMRGHFYRSQPSVLYFRGADPAHYRDKPSWMRHGALGDAVDAFAKAGLVQTITGKKMPWYSKTKSWASSYTPTDMLTRLAVDCGVSNDSIGRWISSDQLVRLYGPKPRREFDWIKGGLVQPGKGKLIGFEPTAETEAWTATLEAINTFYRKQAIGIGLCGDELVGWLAENNADPDLTGATYRMPESFKTDIYRVFNEGQEANPQFDKGGRLFGGWWMSVGEELRKAITSNGKPTVELDYAECHPRMLYHLRGLDGDGELYALPELAAYEAEAGVKPGTYRKYVKWLTQVLINCRGRPQTADKPEKIIAPPDFTPLQIVGLIEAKHQQIAPDFKTGAGLDLMRLESEIALEIVSTAMAEGWPVLSIHDSFITTVDQQDRLKAMMIESYFKRLGKKPVFK